MTTLAWLGVAAQVVGIVLTAVGFAETWSAYAGEPRLLADFAAALEAGEEPVAIVPRWAVLWIGAEARA